MLLTRTIPVLLLHGKGLNKTRRFEYWKYLGDPVNAVRIFNEKEVDELIVLDIDASRNGFAPRINEIVELAGECFMPMCYGGGITDIEQVRRLLGEGIEKVSLNTSAHNNPGLVEEAARYFGSQSIVVSIDVRETSPGRWSVFSNSGRQDRKVDPVSFAVQMQDRGAGEILLYDIDRDGTKSGYNLDLIGRVSESVDIPVVAAGGAGHLGHLQQAIRAGAHAVAAGSLFVLIGRLDGVLISYPAQAELERLYAGLGEFA
ncbi:imidazole glycerol phosphate synthase subunit HisF [Pseudaminobacter arsenicus]|uniref:Imidazole glycerol phosphate synthase subunit HisF n=1 Tax=Borborobacter arsenicus TaxID=1851146 RepID=A0A432V9K5_9HYPH|nr:AglZ/HisF2 family acetamidino modification protein [Pseudaminobacter arsenicus]RUM98857.1 imidazole glycerol phosphate synthase subunit HisF [Pseudaminobacter arsenicus]